jgi:Uncharacterized conserved protein (COG2071)
MQIPVIRGVIDRRILVNFRVDPDVLSRFLPHRFSPKLVNGVGMAGVCLIRLKHIRPRFLPALLGISSENAAHRIAVEWDQDSERHEGVFIPRRDTSSRLTTLAGGRLFPGVHQRARFQVQERDDHFRVEVDSDDREVHLLVDGRVGTELPGTSIFSSVAEASSFFERGSVGYSVTRETAKFDGLELRSFTWQVRPLVVEHAESSFFEDQERFPPGSVEFDSALLMEHIEHEWHSKGALAATTQAFSPAADR